MRQLRGRQKQLLYILAAVAVTISTVGNPIPVKAEKSESAVVQESRGGCEESDDRLYYVALGDSIPNGYCADQESEIVSYPELIAEDIREISGEEMELSRETKNGLTTTKLNEVILRRPEVQEELQRADVVTMTIGANDLMNEFKKVAKEILNNETRFHTVDEALQALESGIKENPLLLFKVAGAISDWDYDSFEARWKETMVSINSMRSENSQFVVTTIYNPVEKMELPGTLNAVVNSVISKMNDIIWKHADEYGYQVVELLESGIGELTQSDGLHPNQSGQNLICTLTEAQMDMSVFEEIRAEKEAAARAEQAAEEAAAQAEKEAREKAAAEEARREKEIQKKREAAGFVGVAAAVGMMAVLKKSEEKKSEEKKQE